MFSQSADQPAADQSPAPDGMRELPPQPAKPVMPAYGTATPAAAPAPDESGPGPEDSVIAKDDHLEGTFTSRGTVVVMGSVKGRIEAVQVRIEDGASVDADVIVDEAIIAGEFTGNLTCRERLEARASGRINGRVETYRLMLHEGASVEGEMHMLTESPKDASETIRGSAPLRGDGDGDSGADAKATTAEGKPQGSSTSSVAPTSSTKPAGGTGTSTASSASGSATAAPATPEEASAIRSSVTKTLRAESASMQVTPRATATSRGYGSPPDTSGRGASSKDGSTTTGI